MGSVPQQLHDWTQLHVAQQPRQLVVTLDIITKHLQAMEIMLQNCHNVVCQRGSHTIMDSLVGI